MKKRDVFSPVPCRGCRENTEHQLGCRFYGTSIPFTEGTWESMLGPYITGDFPEVQRGIDRLTLVKLYIERWTTMKSDVKRVYFPHQSTLKATPNGPGYWCNADQGWVTVGTNA